MDAGRPVVRRVLRNSSNTLKRKSVIVPPSQKVKLEKILGLTVANNAALDTDPHTGTIAYPAGCVVVLYNPKRSKQNHIFNTSKKTITALAFSRDGRNLVTGECGHQPAVRVWDLDDYTQVSELHGHKFGINCVAFSSNLKYIVSIGTQHDMVINVWNWKTNSKVASNKVAANVSDVAFSEEGGYFVTVGNRHVKFWYLDASKSRATANETVPLMGRSGILGEQKNNFFCAVACGKGCIGSKTFVITTSGLLCEFNDKRLLDKWVELRTSRASAIAVSEKYIYIGCADGLVRIFSCLTLHYIASLPRPHYLGIDVSAGQDPSHIVTPPPDAKYPDVIAISFDDEGQKMTCIYKDHSMYIWDVRDIKRVGKSKSFLYHSACIWAVDIYPSISDGSALPRDSFITCSSDDTIRVWNLNSNMDTSTTYKKNIYSNELLKVVYIDPELTSLTDAENASSGSKTDKSDNSGEKNGVRCVCVSPDGVHLASGDRQGNIRVHEIRSMDQRVMLEAHNSEVLSLEFTKKSHGVNLLATASRDRLIHVFDCDQDYGLIQTLDDHSSAITAIKFTEQEGTLNMLSCGADKSLLFRNAQRDPELQFVLNKHLVGRTTLYDMDVDPTQKFVATACQDRNIRIYNMKNGKQKKCYSGSVGTDGTVIRVQLDVSGSYAVTSCSDKNLCVLDFFSGEVLASMFGHSEVVTGVKFMNDFKHIISVSGDGCIFVWKLPIEMIEQAQNRMLELQENKNLTNGNLDYKPVSSTISLEKSLDMLDSVHRSHSQPVLDNNANIPEQEFKPDYSFNVGHLPSWAKKQLPVDNQNKGSPGLANAQVPKGRWAQGIEGSGITLKSVMDDSSINLTLAECMGENSPKLKKRDKRRFTVEPETLSNQLEQLSNLRRETMVISQDKKPSVPIITDDDENNVDEEEDDDFRPATEGETTSMNEDRLSVFRGHQHLGYSNSSETDEKDDDPQENNVIYYLPNKEEVESPDAMSRSFQVFEGDVTIARDQAYKKGAPLATQFFKNLYETESEGTDPTSVEDISDDDNDSTAMMSDISKGFVTPDQEKFLRDHFESLALKESFANTLDDLAPDPTPSKNGLNDSFITNRLSISTRFLSRAQQQLLSKQALGHSTPNPSATQRKREEVSKAMEDTRKRLHALGWRGTNEKESSKPQDLPSPPTKDGETTPRSSSRQSRRKPEPGSERRKTIGDVRQDLTPSPIVVDIPITTPSTPDRKRWSTDPSNIRKWQSMLDISDGRTSPAAKAQASRAAAPRSKTPLSYSMSSGGRILPQTPTSSRYASKMEIKLDGSVPGGQLKRSSSRSRSEKNLAAAVETAEANRRRSAKPSYMQQTSSSKSKLYGTKSGSTVSLNKLPTEQAKTDALTMPPPIKAPVKRTPSLRRGRLSSGTKSKFKSTPNLAADLSNDCDSADNIDVVDDIGFPTATSDGSPELLKSAFSSPIKRTMPATKEPKDPYINGNIPTTTVSTEPTKSVWKRVQPEFKTEGDLANNQKEGDADDSFANVRSRRQDIEDRLSMPPPPTTEVPNSRLAKTALDAKSTPTEITLDQAKDILLGKSAQKTDTSYTSLAGSKSQLNNVDKSSSSNEVVNQQTSSSSLYPSAPWRSVYTSNSGTSSTSTTVVASTGSPKAMAISDLDETPVKDETVPARPRSRVEVSNIHLGAVSPLPHTQLASAGGSSPYPKPSNTCNTTNNVFMSSVSSPRRTESAKHLGPREGEPGDIPRRIGSSSGGTGGGTATVAGSVTPIKSILKEPRSFPAEDSQLEEAEPGVLTPEEGEAPPLSDKSSPDVTLEKPKATVLSRNRENILNSLFGPGGKSATKTQTPESSYVKTTNAATESVHIAQPQVTKSEMSVFSPKSTHPPTVASLTQSSVTTTNATASPRVSSRRRSGHNSPLSPAAATMKAQMDQTYKEHRLRNQQQQQTPAVQNIPVTSIENVKQQNSDNVFVKTGSNINHIDSDRTKAITNSSNITSSVSSNVQSNHMLASMDSMSTDSFSSSSDVSPRNVVTTVPDRTGLHLPLQKVNQPQPRNPEDTDAFLADLKKSLDLYSKLPDNNANKIKMKTGLCAMRDLLTTTLGSPIQPCAGVTDTETRRLLQQYSAEMVDKVWHLFQSKNEAQKPSSEENIKLESQV